MQVFQEWEVRVKTKARRNHLEQELTGGGIGIIEILTNLEKRLLEVLSKILIYGNPHVFELGFKSRKTNKCTLLISKLNKRYQKRVFGKK